MRLSREVARMRVRRREASIYYLLYMLSLRLVLDETKHLSHTGLRNISLFICMINLIALKIHQLHSLID